MVVAVTGANGFVGRHIANYLEEKHQKVRRISRQETGDYSGALKLDWLDGANAIVHTAAIAHSGHKLSDVQIQRIQRINSDAVVEIAQRAAGEGVERFIFISSAHVYGRSADGTLDEDAETLPTNIYGATKMDAENRLVALAEETGLQLIIFRPPLLYGAGVKANFRMLVKLVNTGMLLPFAALNQPRSYCYVDNLSDAIFQCLRRDDVWNDVYNIADKTPLGMADLCKQIARSLDKIPTLIYVPKWLIKVLLTLTGRRHMIEALCKPLVLDTRSFQHTLNWQPPFTLEHGLSETAAWFKDK